MKLLITLITIILPLFLLAQDYDINTIKVDEESTLIYDIYDYSDSTLLMLHTTRTENNVCLYSYNYYDKTYEKIEVPLSTDLWYIYPIKILEVNGDNIVTLNHGYKSSLGYLFTTKLNLKEKTSEVISIVEVVDDPQRFDRLNFTSVSQCGDSHFTFFNLGIGDTPFQGLAKVDKKFNVKILKIAKKSTEPFFHMFHRYVPDMICLNENRFLLGASYLSLNSVVDSSLNILHVINVHDREDPRDSTAHWITAHSFTKTAEDSIYISGVGPDTKAVSLRNYHWFLKPIIKNDSISYETLNRFSDPDSTSLDENSSIVYNSYNNSLYTVSQQQFSYQPVYKTQINQINYPRKFYVRKITDNQEVWTRIYGGDANYNIVNIQALKNGHLVVFGHVFNYFNEQRTNGFFMLVDPDGDLVSSNIDIQTLDRHVNVFPNPTSNYINIDSADDYSAVRVFDNQGRLILEQTETVSNQIDTQDWPSGMYTLQLFYGKNIVSKRVVKIQ